MKNGKSVNRPVLFVVTVVWCMAIQPAFAGSGWGECRWMEIGPARSHQAGTGAWCPEGFFLTQLDLDSSTSLDGHDSPYVGRARCCRPPGNGPAAWESCTRVPVGGPRSHQRGPEWCPQGMFLTRLDLDGDRAASAHDTPYVGQAVCCRSAGSGTSGWGSSQWVAVGPQRSHQAGQPWCPEGTYLTQLDLDGGTQFSEYDAPVVGAARCSSPMAVMEVLPLDQVDLKLTNLAIIPPPEGINGPRITLHTYRSYRVEVSIQRNGIGQVADFKVRTECVRGGTPFLLGETMVSGPAGGGGKLGAVYDIFPSSAGYGDCLLRTIIDADNVVAESDESPLSNIWERQARITR